MSRRLPPLTALHPTDPPTGVPDADLLTRWVTHRDESAFELLVRRHTPTVFAACRRLLCDPNDADDAFQATFLVFARKAASITRREVLAAWLHRVACRVALRVRADHAKRTERREPNSVEQLSAPPAADPAWTELIRVLDEEVERLPARHRAVFILCCLEGKTGEEAGQLLGCPPGTVSSRLTRARQRLRDRLTRRGFAPAGLLVAALTGNALAVIVPSGLIESVIRAGLVFPEVRPNGAPPNRPETIAQGVVKAMFVQKLKFVSAFLVVGVLAVGGVLAGAVSNSVGDNETTQPRANDRAAHTKEPPAVPVGPLVSADARTPKEEPPAKTGDAEASLKRQMLDAARKVYEDSTKRYQAGVSASVEELYLWSIRWLDAEFDLAADAAAKTTALKAHLERMKQVEKICVAFAKTGQGRQADAAAGRYYRTQAELWVTRGRR